ncbi:MAG: HEAT repeat domain-containing protein [Deltaproteobacteria bacterium]|nr:HEAT repeat domain-containing protein [Deltaproteobacteria bacterium]
MAFDTRVKRVRAATIAVWCAVALGCVLLGAPALHAELPKKLLDGLASSSSKVRIVAVSNVARSKDPQARALIEPLLKDEDPAVRAAVIEGLGRIADPAALAALKGVAADQDGTVQAVLKRVVPALEALVVYVYVGEARDLSGGTMPGLADKLRRDVKSALLAKLGPGFIMIDDPSKKSYGATPLNIRSITRSKDGRTSFLEVKCELTLVEMPGNILRAALSSSAAVGVEGEISKKLEPELANDAVTACAPEVASDFVAYVKEHSRR